jgi:hypothetical protein
MQTVFRAKPESAKAPERVAPALSWPALPWPPDPRLLKVDRARCDEIVEQIVDVELKPLKRPRDVVQHSVRFQVITVASFALRKQRSSKPAAIKRYARKLSAATGAELERLLLPQNVPEELEAPIAGVFAGDFYPPTPEGEFAAQRDKRARVIGTSTSEWSKFLLRLERLRLLCDAVKDHGYYCGQVNSDYVKLNCATSAHHLIQAYSAQTGYRRKPLRSISGLLYEVVSGKCDVDVDLKRHYDKVIRWCRMSDAFAAAQANPG